MLKEFGDEMEQWALWLKKCYHWDSCTVWRSAVGCGVILCCPSGSSSTAEGLPKLESWAIAQRDSHWLHKQVLLLMCHSAHSTSPSPAFTQTNCITIFICHPDAHQTHPWRLVHRDLPNVLREEGERLL